MRKLLFFIMLIPSTCFCATIEIQWNANGPGCTHARVKITDGKKTITRSYLESEILGPINEEDDAYLLQIKTFIRDEKLTNSDKLASELVLESKDYSIVESKDGSGDSVDTVESVDLVEK